MDTISKIRSLQTELNNEELDIPKMRRNVTVGNMRWLLRNVKINNGHCIWRTKVILAKIQPLLKELI